jgi:hypothetical protein
VTGDVPVVGNWNGDGLGTKVGVFRDGYYWVLDYNGDRVFDTGDLAFPYGGIAGDVPVVGQWFSTTSAGSSTTLAASPNPSSSGSAVTLNASVIGSPPGATATGSVSFYDLTLAVRLGDSGLNSTGVATLAVPILGAGIHTIAAYYSGDANYGPSSAAPVIQGVYSTGCQTLREYIRAGGTVAAIETSCQ